MSHQIRVACSPGERLVALLQEDILQEIAIWRPGAPDGVGDLYRGRVSSVMPAMAGRFVALDGMDGFLPDSECPVAAPSGTRLGVRVTRAAQGGKGPRLTARLGAAEQAMVGDGAAGLVARGPDPVSLMAMRFPDAQIRVDDTAIAAALRPGLAARLAWVERAFDDALQEEVAALASPEAGLAGGGRLLITPTPALTAIDVDTGGAAGQAGTKTALLGAFNRAVLPALARQIRLRNLSGAILIDLAGLSAKRRRALGPDLATALAADPLRPRLLGFTALGLAEIVRPRIHPPLHEMLSGPHAAGLAALRRAAAETMAGRSAVLRAAPAVIACLQSDRHALAELAQQAGCHLITRVEPALAPVGWSLETA